MHCTSFLLTLGNPLLVFCRRFAIMSPIMGRKRRNGEKRYQKCSDFIADLGRCLRNGSCISAAGCGGTYYDGFCLCRLYHIPSDRSVSLSKGFDEPVNGKAGFLHLAALSVFCSGNRIFHRKKSFCPTAHAAGQDWEVQERFGLLALPKLFLTSRGERTTRSPLLMAVYFAQRKMFFIQRAERRIYSS